MTDGSCTATREVRRSRWRTATAVTIAVVGSALVWAAPASAATTTVSFGYTDREYQVFTIPDGVEEVTVVARGGGGGDGKSGGSVGADTRGKLSVRPGEKLLLGVGGTGQQWQRGDKISGGGWGGLNASGGSSGGLQASGGGGGGATTVEVERRQGRVPVMIAGGGGGDGSPAGTFDSYAGGGGGDAGGNPTADMRYAPGADGDGGSNGAESGKAAITKSGAGASSHLSASRGGGGGGGGFLGGTAGESTYIDDPGGGGGAGASKIDLSVRDPEISSAPTKFNAKNGEVTVTWESS